MKNSWWKILGVLLLLYTILAGFLVPLRPGIQTSQPTTAQAGSDVQLEVHGYNTNWSERSNEIRVWLKLDDEKSIQAQRTEVSSDVDIKAWFSLPSQLPVKTRVGDLALIVDHPEDGPSVLPTALVVTRVSNADKQVSWDQNAIHGLHFKKTFAFPYRNIIFETIRNMFFHVPLWMAMYGLMALATYFNVQYLRTSNEKLEEHAFHLVVVALLYGFLGITTGMIWAEFAWGKFWSWDIKQTMSLLSMLIFVAYIFIRFSIPDEKARRRFNAVYGIFGFIMIFPLLYIVPRMAPSLHPGSGGNPAFGSDDMDNTMRIVFYPAILGYFLLGLWLAQLSFRMSLLKRSFLLKN